MRLRFTVMSALILTAGCASRVSVAPAPKSRDVAAARPAAVALPPKSETIAEAPGAGTQGIPAADPEAPPPLTASATAGATDSAAPTHRTKADPFGDVGFKEVNEKDWLAGIRQKIAQREKVAPADVCLSPGMLRAAFVRSPPVAAPPRPGRRAAPRRHEIVVVDNQGKQVASFRPVVARGSDEPPADLRFLSEDRLVYEVIARVATDTPVTSIKRSGAKAKVRSAASTKQARPHARPSTKPTHEATRAIVAFAAPTMPPVPQRLFVIQPLTPRARPIRCEGFNFTFTHDHDRLAFVGGQADRAFVAVDGAQVYPRRGRTIVTGGPAWSKDGRSLAFLEQPATHPARLVLVAAIDDAAGDTTWDLPADAKIDGSWVIWAGNDKLIVRKTALKPIFSTSFVTQR